MEEKHQRLQAGGWQRDDAELQLVLKHVFRNLLISHSNREYGLALQGVTQSKETLQVTVLGLKELLTAISFNEYTEIYVPLHNNA